MEIKITVIDREGERHETEAPTDMNFNMMEICKAMDKRQSPRRFVCRLKGYRLE